MRIGPRYDKICANINTYDGRLITWSKELRYLGFFIVFHRFLDVRWTTPSARSIEQQMRYLEKKWTDSFRGCFIAVAEVEMHPFCTL